MKRAGIYQTLVHGADDQGCVLLCLLAAQGASSAQATQVDEAVSAVSREASHQNWRPEHEFFRRRFM